MKNNGDETTKLEACMVMASPAPMTCESSDFKAFVHTMAEWRKDLFSICTIAAKPAGKVLRATVRLGGWGHTVVHRTVVGIWMRTGMSGRTLCVCSICMFYWGGHCYG